MFPNVCAECGGERSRLVDWFRCGNRKFCSTDCAIEFLLLRAEYDEGGEA
jgi:hypothetical protein